jgi:hypothetical protein
MNRVRLDGKTTRMGGKSLEGTGKNRAVSHAQAVSYPVDVVQDPNDAVQGGRE